MRGERMTSRDFCYWLQGYFELRGGADAITAEQARVVQQHLALVFKHEIDPSAGPPAHQAALNAIHSGAEPAWKQSHDKPVLGGPVLRC